MDAPKKHDDAQSALASVPRIPRSHRGKSEHGGSTNEEAARDCDGFLVILYYEFRAGNRVTMAPDGRKCKSCKLRDSDWDPAAYQNKIKKYCYWERKPNPDGTSCGHRSILPGIVLSFDLACSFTNFVKD